MCMCTTKYVFKYVHEVFLLEDKIWVHENNVSDIHLNGMFADSISTFASYVKELSWKTTWTKQMIPVVK